MKVAVIDYGAGNLTSVVKAFVAVGAAPYVATDSRQLKGAVAMVIPGVGHFDATAPLGGEMRNAISSCLSAGVPLLGICLGMQWLFEGSDEAPGRPGLGVFPGRCTRLASGLGLKVPHVGWNTIDPAGPASRLLSGLPAGASAYFTHTYAAPDGPATVGRTTHGAPFVSVVERSRVFGTQFHPEKSGALGLTMLRTFVEIAREAAAQC